MKKVSNNKEKGTISSNSELISSKNELSFLVKTKYLKLLQLFISNPDKEYYVNEIKSETGLSPQIVCDELKVLEKQGFLVSLKRANALFYRLNSDNKYITELRGLFF